MRVLYWGRDGSKEFDIQVDGKKIAGEKLKGGKEEDYRGIEYPIAKQLLEGKQKITVRFQAPEGGNVARVFETRIVIVK